MKWNRPGVRDQVELAARERRRQAKLQEVALGAVPACTVQRGMRFVYFKAQQEVLLGQRTPTRDEVKYPPSVYTATGRASKRGRVIATTPPLYRESEERYVERDRLVYPLPALPSLPASEADQVGDDEEI